MGAYENAPMEIGYARVSTEDQHLDLQLDALDRAGVPRSRVYEEHASGAKANRVELKACMRALREGDVLVVWRLDRLARSLRELIEITEDLSQRGIGLRSLNEAIDTSTALGQFFLHIIGAVAQFERDLISERTIAGLAAARKRGKQGGRKPKIDARKLKIMKLAIASGEDIKAVCEQFGVSRSAFYRALERERDARRRELIAAMEAEGR